MSIEGTCIYCGKKGGYEINSDNLCGNHLARAVDEFDNYNDGIDSDVSQTGVVVISLKNWNKAAIKQFKQEQRK